MSSGTDWRQRAPRTSEGRSRRAIGAAPVTDPWPLFQPGDALAIGEGRRKVKGILVLYYFPAYAFFRDASTILEHVGAFDRHSQFEVWNLNTDLPFPPRLAEIDFEAVVLHYSLIGGGVYNLNRDHLEWLRSSRAYKVAFFQDENRFTRQRFNFIDEFGVDCVYTCLEPPAFDAVYGSRTKASVIRTNIPGYVSDELVETADRMALPDEKRTVDVAYRGRPIPPFAGRGAQEKVEIGQRFLERAAGSGLELDILVGEEDRLYGDGWFKLMARSKAVLGVESGVSVFDIDDEVVAEYERLSELQPQVTIEDLERGPLKRYEDKIFYRTISPRHFEAAAFGTTQILYEGRYSGILEPMTHYIPLRKDFSNFDEVVRLVSDPGVRTEITANARRDLIDSGRYSYRAFVEEFDRGLIEAGLDPDIPPEDANAVRAAIRSGRARRWARVQAWWFNQMWLSPRLVRALTPMGRALRAVRRALPGRERPG